MSGSPGTGGSNPRKFSEKIALHNQKQAEETRAFEQLMTDLNVSRVNALRFGVSYWWTFLMSWNGGVLCDVTVASVWFRGFLWKPGCFWGAKQLKSENQMIKSQRKPTSKWNLVFKTPCTYFVWLQEMENAFEALLPVNIQFGSPELDCSLFFLFCNKSVSSVHMQDYTGDWLIEINGCNLIRILDSHYLTAALAGRNSHH